MASSLKIVISDDEEERGGGGQKDKHICSLCLTQFAKYTCPRCNVQYCSLSCYKSKKHEQCSESFYKECCMEELQQQKGGGEQKRKMVDILMHMHSAGGGGGEEEKEGEEEDEKVPNLEDRLAGLNLDSESEAVWQRLTIEEKRGFHQMLSSGGMEKLVALHTPWWEYYRPVIPLGDHEESTSPVPTELKDLPPLSALMSGTVAPTIRYNIVNVLYAYAYAVRFFNGEHFQLPLQSSEAVLSISSCLPAGSLFSMVGEALRHAMVTAQQLPKLFNSSSFSLSVMKDVSQILSHRRSHDCHVTQALSDLYRLLNNARVQLKAEKDKTDSEESERNIKRLWLTKKKVFFFTVWSKENLQDLSHLARVVDIEHDSIEREFAEAEQGELAAGRSGGKEQRKLIEELN